MSKRVTPNRYRLYYLPASKNTSPKYVLHDFKANITKAEDKTFFHPSFLSYCTLLHTFNKHPGSFADIRQNYPELFI